MTKLVVMGVAGCGKSTVGQMVATRRGVPLVEGDDFHSLQSRIKMRRGVALTDADREGWLDQLAGQLRDRPADDLVLTCSALKRAYRERLRGASPGLRFVFLDIDRAGALRRVAARVGRHLFPASLVDSQFDALERPDGEPGVLAADATAAATVLCDRICTWLRNEDA